MIRSNYIYDNSTIVAVTVEYTDAKTGDRVRKDFKKEREARRFYIQQSEAGREPKIVRAAREAF